MIVICQSCGKMRPRQPHADNRMIQLPCIHAYGCPGEQKPVLIDIFKLTNRKPDVEPHTLRPVNRLLSSS